MISVLGVPGYAAANPMPASIAPRAIASLPSSKTVEPLGCKSALVIIHHLFYVIIKPPILIWIERVYL